MSYELATDCVALLLKLVCVKHDTFPVTDFVR